MSVATTTAAALRTPAVRRGLIVVPAWSRPGGET